MEDKIKENFILIDKIKRLQSKNEIIEQFDREIQTEITFKNENYMVEMDKILFKIKNNKLSKAVKLMKDASANVNDYKPMSY